MTVTERVAKLRAFALTAKTAVYNEDAMTAIELAGQTACKVNEMIDAINEMLDLLEAAAGVLGIRYDEEKEELVI